MMARVFTKKGVVSGVYCRIVVCLVLYINGVLVYLRVDYV